MNRLINNIDTIEEIIFILLTLIAFGLATYFGSIVAVALFVITGSLMGHRVHIRVRQSHAINAAQQEEINELKNKIIKLDHDTNDLRDQLVSQQARVMRGY